MRLAARTTLWIHICFQSSTVLSVIYQTFVRQSYLDTIALCLWGYASVMQNQYGKFHNVKQILLSTPSCPAATTGNSRIYQSFLLMPCRSNIEIPSCIRYVLHHEFVYASLISSPQLVMLFGFCYPGLHSRALKVLSSALRSQHNNHQQNPSNQYISHDTISCWFFLTIT